MEHFWENIDIVRSYFCTVSKTAGNLGTISCSGHCQLGLWSTHSIVRYIPKHLLYEAVSQRKLWSTLTEEEPTQMNTWKYKVVNTWMDQYGDKKTC